ncbi:shikimate dehydrogenase [Saxibacter everestensis]|uniref:Shikimate dehydrogenase n=1 Tax=Saxibacter everestensis TaxID=2909229 RepID=A0ABY8QXX7_9MICO|nr:shikimate dehydrogenase [Brevibacteriaceae bacterium ZFBP1038]
MGKDRFRAGVLGKPISHTLSPRLHRAGYAACGFNDWQYEAYELDADQLGDFLTEHADFLGFSLTMPLKQELIRLHQTAGEVDRVAAATAAGNTVVLAGSATAGRDAVPGRGQVYNTDVLGIERAFRFVAPDARFDRPAVLGGGATAASAVAALIGLGAGEIQVFVRNLARTEAVKRTADLLGASLSVRPLDDWEPAEHDSVISTLPAGAADELSARILPYDVIAPDDEIVADSSRALLDVAYARRLSPLLIAWQQSGAVPIDGLNMLVFQAVEQFVLFARAAARIADHSDPLHGLAEEEIRHRVETAMLAEISNDQPGNDPSADGSANDA